MSVADKISLVTTEVKREISAAETRILQIVEGELAKLMPIDSNGIGMPGRALVEVAIQIAKVRRLRRSYFSAELFHERAWDMLLELFIAHATNRDVWVKSLLSAADGSPTTAIRWLDHLEASGLILRRADDEDRRRVIVNLTPKGETAMLAYLQEARSLM